MQHTDKTLWQVVKGYFNALPYKENEEETIQEISRGVTFHGANLWILVFAVFIASLGLNVNSTAVIIGAMLISPLMGPIVGMGLAVGINDSRLLSRSLKLLQRPMLQMLQPPPTVPTPDRGCVVPWRQTRSTA